MNHILYLYAGNGNVNVVVGLWVVGHGVVVVGETLGLWRIVKDGGGVRSGTYVNESRSVAADG